MVYRYIYLPGVSCIQVVVSATNRITGKEVVFSNPCSVPFWYDEIRDYNPEKLLAEKANYLEAPNTIIAYENEVSLLLPSRECEKTYTIERSYDTTEWEEVATVTFDTFKNTEPSLKSCENSFVDNQVALGTQRLWYRYGLLDETGVVTIWSNIGEVVMEEYQQ